MTGQVTGDVAEVLDTVRGALDDAAAHVEGICRTVEAVLGALPGTNPTELADLRRAYAAVERQLGTLLVAAGDPAALRTTGARWIDEVGAPVSGLVVVASDAVLQADSRWTGAAADAYRAMLLVQRGALTAIVATCQDVDTTLDALASAVTAFWIAIGGACLGLVIALAGALGAAATAVGAPAAAGIALAGVGAMVVAGDKALSSLTMVTTAASARTAALHHRLTDDTAFPLGHWPPTTRNLPPDASGWQVRPR